MDRIEIVNLFRKDKIFLTPEVLDILVNNVQIVDKVKEKCLRDNVFLVDIQYLRKILEEDVEIRIEYPEEVKEFKVDDIILQLKERLEYLSSLIIQNNQLKEIYSIGRLSRIKKDFDSGIVVGLVKEKTTYTFTLEDISGNMIIKGEAKDIEKINIDEVLGVEVFRENESFIAKKLFFPSFSFFRKIFKLNRDVIFKYDSCIVNGVEFKIKTDSAVRLYVGDVKIFVLNFNLIRPYFHENYLEDVCLLLEKRHLNPTIVKNGKLYKNDFFMLRDIPEYIIIVDSPENVKKIYKGVQIFFLRKDSSVDLKKGEFL